VRSLVEMHGGSVVAKSEGLNRGAELTVRLPRTTKPSERPRKLGVKLDGSGSKIVLVEDNDDSREMMKMILESMGFQVYTAANGARGKSLIEEVQPDIAFVDIGLPLTNGYQVASHVRAQKTLQAVFLVALTGYGQPADRERALEAGFDEHLVKPLTMERLTRLFSGQTTSA
jgi:CheY-like chemotaxis protein